MLKLTFDQKKSQTKNNREKAIEEVREVERKTVF